MGNKGYHQYTQCTDACTEECGRHQMKRGRDVPSFAAAIACSCAGNAGINSYRPKLPCFINYDKGFPYFFCKPAWTKPRLAAGASMLIGNIACYNYKPFNETP